MKAKLLFVFLLTVNILTNSYAQIIGNKDLSLKQNKTFTIDVGTEIIRFGGNSYFGNYISPKISYNLLPKFNINMGFMLSNLSTINTSGFNGENMNTGFNPIFSNYLLVEGEYLFSDKLSIIGSGYMQIPVMQYNDNNNNNNNNPLIQNNKEFHIGLNYKITESIQIRADFGVTNNPYRSIYSKYSSNPFFTNNPFFY